MAYRNPDEGKARNRERFRERVAERRAAGMCVGCGRCPPESGLVNCAACAEKRRTRGRARDARLRAEGRALRDPEKARAAHRRYYHRKVSDRRRAGTCLRCGSQPPVPGRTTCVECAEKLRKYERDRYAAGKAEGLPYGGSDPETKRRLGRVRSARRREAWLDADLCTRCGRNPPAEGGTTCTACRQKRQHRDRRKYAERRAAGSCVICGVRTFEGAAYCAPCIAKDYDSGRTERKNAASRERYRKRRQAGRCVECNRPSQGACRCPECARRSYESSSHFRGIPFWEPEFTVVDLLTGEEHGPMESEAEAAAYIAFLRLPSERFEIITDCSPATRYTGGHRWDT